MNKSFFYEQLRILIYLLPFIQIIEKILHNPHYIPFAVCSWYSWYRFTNSVWQSRINYIELYFHFISRFRYLFFLFYFTYIYALRHLINKMCIKLYGWCMYNMTVYDVLLNIFIYISLVMRRHSPWSLKHTFYYVHTR